MDHILFGFQMILFYITFVGGIVSFFFHERLPVPLWGMIAIWATVLVIQILFLVVAVKLPAEKEEHSFSENEEELLKKELEELEKEAELRGLRKLAKNHQAPNHP